MAVRNLNHLTGHDQPCIAWIESATRFGALPLISSK